MTKIIIMALVGAFIGYITNSLAITLLFRPYEKIGPFQGLIPRRRQDLARKIGEVIEKELISMDELMEDIIRELDMERLKKTLTEKIALALKEELPVFVPISLVEGLISAYLKRRGDDLFLSMIQEFFDSEGNLSRISRMVERRILKFDLRELENILWSISRTELRFIINLGGILGLLIGVAQGLLVHFFI